MSDFISRTALLAEYDKHHVGAPGGARKLIEEAPTIDAVTVVHGRWESVQNPQWKAYSHDKCNICGWWNTKNAMCYDGHKKPGHSLNYCPNCGAKMDGGNDEAD